MLAMTPPAVDQNAIGEGEGALLTVKATSM